MLLKSEKFTAFEDQAETMLKWNAPRIIFGKLHEGGKCQMALTEKALQAKASND